MSNDHHIGDGSEGEPDAIRKLLSSMYGIAVDDAFRIPTGHHTANYRVTSGDRSYFVKRYPADVELDAEAKAIEITALARAHAVPTPAVLSTGTGGTIAEGGGITASVWEWAPGSSPTRLSAAQVAPAGEALGRIHRVFRSVPAALPPAPAPADWLRPDPRRLKSTIDKLLGIIAERPHRDGFDELAATTLAERRAAVDHLPELIAGLPPLTSQVIHGDYSPLNLLFDGPRLSAVVDFSPPREFLVAYELGRIAFDPRSVALRDDWIEDGVALVSAYLTENPKLPASDVTASARVALIQLLRSLYGVKNHYLGNDPLQANLDRFWVLRHQAVGRLLERLGEVERILGDVAEDHATRSGH